MTPKDIMTLYPFPEQKADLGFDLCETLHEGREYRLQIEQDEGFFSEPYVCAELVKKNTTTLGWELNFRFISS